MPLQDHARRSHEHFAHTIDQACTLSELRNGYLAGIERVVHADAYGFYELDLNTGTPTGCTARAPDSFLDQYEKHGRQDDPVLRSAQAGAEPVDDARAATREEWLRSGACNVLSTAGFSHSLEAPLIMGDTMVGTLNFARAADKRPFSRRDLRRAAWAGHKMSVGLHRAARFELTGQRASLFAEVLDALDVPLIISSMDGQELYVNPAADRRVNPGAHPAGHVAQPAVTRTLNEIRRDRSLESASTTQPLDDGLNQMIVRSVRLNGSTDAVLSFLSVERQDDHRRPGISLLSPREREIADFVAKGLTTGQMARELFISENTVKQHLKRMFQKMNVHSRAQLVEALWDPVRDEE